MSELILKEDALNCFHDWIDRYGYEHTADEDPVYQRIEALDTVRCCDEDCISRRVAIDAMKDMYRAAEKWLRDATDDVTKARAESCMASLIEIKLRTEKLPAVQPDHVADISKKVEGDCISRQAAIDAIEKCYTCKHVYQRVSDADTLYCRCRKGCRYEEFKPKRSTGNPQGHEGEN